MTTRAFPTMIGTILGRYRVVEKIGEGGMGTVYRAHDEQLDRDVAMKVLPKGALANNSSRRRFRKEALTLAKLNHPNIEAVYEFGSQDGVDFLVLEYVPGSTLADIIRRGALPEKEVAELGIQLAAALEDAHEHGIVLQCLEHSVANRRLYSHANGCESDHFALTDTRSGQHSQLWQMPFDPFR